MIKKEWMDGPYRNTRSSAGSQGKNTDRYGHFDDYLDNTEVFNDEQTYSKESLTPKNSKKERVRTPSGHLISKSVGDIRNFFSAGEERSLLPPVNTGAKKLKFDEVISAKLKGISAGLNKSHK